MLSGVFAFCLLEEWSFLFSLYFVVVTLTTVGYGDMGDWNSEGARLFCTIYAFVGILLLGSALGIIAAELIESHNNAVKKLQSKILEEVVNPISSTTKEEEESCDIEEVVGSFTLKQKAKAFYESIWAFYHEHVPLFIQVRR